MNEQNRFATSRSDQTSRQPGRVGLRGCWELLIKLIILLILILILLAYWFGQLGPFGPRGEYNFWAWLVLLILIALLLWLIWRQKHFVSLNCNLTQPTGCKHGNPNILTGRVLEPIVGTASGIGFSRYVLELVYQSTSIPGAIIYADNAGNPDLGLTFGNHQVNNGTLGFVDIQQAVVGAGMGFLTSTNFEVRLRVVGIDSSRHDCVIAFQIASARAFIKKVGAAWAHAFTNANEILCRIPAPGLPSPGPHAVNPASVGGNIYVRGAANAYGCAAEKISEVHIWAIPDPTFSFAQPANGTALAPPAGGVQISEVIYTDDFQRANNALDGISSDGDILTFAPGWTTREECTIADLFILWCWTVPDIVEIGWLTGATGKYTLLLAVKDTAGNTYYDIQRVWVDNDNVIAQITSIGGLGACLDLKLSTFKGTTCEIRGFAWDRAIRAVDPQAAPNDNFGGYSMSYQKNGGAGGAIAVATPGVRVPSVWAEVAPMADGTLANWNIIADLDFGGPGPVPPGSAKLGRGERCAYVIGLSVSDTTLVGEGGVNHSMPHTYAINIINDL